MAQDTEYNEEIKKLKSKRNVSRLYGVTDGLLAIACGGSIALWAYLLKDYYAFSPPYTLSDLIFIPGFGILGFGVVGPAISCYKEIANSRRTSRKIRKLEKELYK